VLNALTQQLNEGVALTAKQAAGAVRALVTEDIAVELKAEFLTALARKGETVEEIAAFAHALLKMAIVPPLDKETRARPILDVCGTGGDRLNTFNISTTVALVAASAGISVAKHGNRAITSQAGSADVLEALGIKIDLTPAQAAASLRDHHFAFFFAPNYHPGFRQIGPARRLCGERGQRTIFNFVGPLLNPARPDRQLIGVPEPQLCARLGAVLPGLGVRRGMVVCGSVFDGTGERHLDELSTLGENHVVEFSGNETRTRLLSPADFPIQPASLSDLAGADRMVNARIVRRILHGEERGPKRDAVLLNSAAALFLTGESKSLGEGWEMAAELIDSGRTMRKLAELVKAF
jgi:anthranilate phosphoribosyltransferase